MSTVPAFETKAMMSDDSIVNWDVPHVRMTWTKVDFGGCVYALLFSNGTTKVGKSQHLRGRFNTHLRSMSYQEARLVDFWFSGHSDYFDQLERQAIRAAESLMTEVSSKTGKEYFHHIDFVALLAVLQELDPCTPQRPAAVPA